MIIIIIDKMQETIRHEKGHLTLRDDVRKPEEEDYTENGLDTG